MANADQTDARIPAGNARCVRHNARIGCNTTCRLHWRSPRLRAVLWCGIMHCIMCVQSIVYIILYSTCNQIQIYILCARVGYYVSKVRNMWPSWCCTIVVAMIPCSGSIVLCMCHARDCGSCFFVCECRERTWAHCITVVWIKSLKHSKQYLYLIHEDDGLSKETINHFHVCLFIVIESYITTHRTPAFNILYIV